MDDIFWNYLLVSNCNTNTRWHPNIHNFRVRPEKTINSERVAQKALFWLGQRSAGFERNLCGTLFRVLLSLGARFRQGGASLTLACGVQPLRGCCSSNGDSYPQSLEKSLFADLWRIRLTAENLHSACRFPRRVYTFRPFAARRRED